MKETVVSIVGPINHNFYQINTAILEASGRKNVVTLHRPSTGECFRIAHARLDPRWRNRPWTIRKHIQVAFRMLGLIDPEAEGSPWRDVRREDKIHEIPGDAWLASERQAGNV